MVKTKNQGVQSNITNIYLIVKIAEIAPTKQVVFQPAMSKSYI